MSRLPAEPGIYRFRAADGRVLYVGRACDLRRRVSSYWGDLRDRGHLAPMVRRVARIEALVCASGHEAAWAERSLLERSLPPWNRTPGGQEVPVHILLDATSRAPVLRAVHEPGATGHAFGPYLGGRRVRLAVAALQRVFPPASCSTRPTAAERDLAERRRPGVATLPELTAAITAVLECRPAAVAAVVAELSARRDAAAAALAYELAARVQEEMVALGWVVAPALLTRARGDHADLAAWADGTLLRLTVRDGLLHGWDQGPSPSGGSGVEAPSSWAGFLTRNATLAAALAGLPVV